LLRILKTHILSAAAQKAKTFSGKMLADKGAGGYNGGGAVGPGGVINECKRGGWGAKGEMNFYRRREVR